MIAAMVACDVCRIYMVRIVVYGMAVWWIEKRSARVASVQLYYVWIAWWKRVYGSKFRGEKCGVVAW